MTDKLTDLEINEACHKIITGGKGCWHGDFHGPSYARHSICGLCSEQSFKEGGRNPDPLNNEKDWASLVFYVVNEWDKEKWEAFLTMYKWKDENGHLSMMGLIEGLFSNKRALPTALVEWKEGEDV